MKFIKNNKLLTIFLGIVLLFIIFIGAILSKFIINKETDEYGNRLEGIENVAVKDSSIKNMKKELEADDSINKLTYKLKGRLINIIIEVKDGTSLDSAKAFGNKTLEYFDDEEKAYYDIQVFLKNSNELNEEYPIIGYKHKTSASLVWN